MRKHAAAWGQSLAAVRSLQKQMWPYLRSQVQVLEKVNNMSCGGRCAVGSGGKSVGKPLLLVSCKESLKIIAMLLWAKQGLSSGGPPGSKRDLWPCIVPMAFCDVVPL